MLVASSASADRAVADREDAVAQALFAKSDFAGAAAHFHAAYVADPRPELICNVGISYQKANDLPRAQLFLTECVLHGSTLALDRVAAVRATIAEIEGSLRAGSFTPFDLTVEPAGATIAISDYPAEEAFAGARIVWLPYGKHSIVVRAEGYTDKTAVADAHSHDVVPIRVKLDRVVVAPPPITHPPAGPAPSKVPMIAAGGVTVAALVLGGIAFSLAHSDADRAHTALTKTAFDADQSSVSTWNTVLGVSGLVAIAGAVATTYFFVHTRGNGHVDVVLTPTTGELRFARGVLSSPTIAIQRVLRARQLVGPERDAADDGVTAAAVARAQLADVVAARLRGPRVDADGDLDALRRPRRPTPRTGSSGTAGSRGSPGCARRRRRTDRTRSTSSCHTPSLLDRVELARALGLDRRELRRRPRAAPRPRRASRATATRRSARCRPACGRARATRRAAAPGSSSATASSADANCAASIVSAHATASTRCGGGFQSQPVASARAIRPAHDGARRIEEPRRQVLALEHLAQRRRLERGRVVIEPPAHLRIGAEPEVDARVVVGVERDAVERVAVLVDHPDRREPRPTGRRPRGRTRRTYLSQAGQQELCHTTSWGMSIRMVGGAIMAHGDDKGLVLPPRIAPYQVVIVPIARGEGDDAVQAAARDMARRLKAAGIRAHVDDRPQVSPGFKFNEWELRGMPLRLEIGPRELAGTALLARRLGGEGKTAISLDTAPRKR